MSRIKTLDFALFTILFSVLVLLFFIFSTMSGILTAVSDMKDQQAKSQAAHYNSFLQVVKDSNSDFNAKLDARIAQRVAENAKFRDDMKADNQAANERLLEIVERIDDNVKHQLEPVATSAAETQEAVHTASTAAATAAKIVKETPRSVQVITMSQVQAKQQSNYLKAVSDHNKEVDKYNSKFHTHLPHQKP